MNLSVNELEKKKRFVFSLFKQEMLIKDKQNTLGRLKSNRKRNRKNE